jgi:hypothetical protein
LNGQLSGSGSQREQPGKQQPPTAPWGAITEARQAATTVPGHQNKAAISPSPYLMRSSGQVRDD